ncbi:FAD-dependent monooxygenase [Streptomyces sp. NPDC057235]|uniref:FAD-dependent monooxygenase n=1 Tax=Streptomyces sp. NPDC057235 TaxID=3346058 RepID=UPI00362F3A38
MGGADGAVVTRRAAYVVGADGHRSAVRQAIGPGFPGPLRRRVADPRRRPVGGEARRGPRRQRPRRRLREDRLLPRRPVPGHGLEPSRRGPRRRPARPRRGQGRHPPCPGLRPRRARGPLTLPFPQRRAPGAAPPGRTGLPHRGHCPHPLPGRPGMNTGLQDAAGLSRKPATAGHARDARRPHCP